MSGSTNARTILSTAAAASLVVINRLPVSALTRLLWYSALGYLLIDTLRKVRTGYVRRRPYWTRESWRRFSIVCAVFVGALLVALGMTELVDLGNPAVGAARSSTRAAWAAAIIAFLMIGAVGFAIALDWLAQGDPSRQFTWWPRRFRTPSKPGSAV